VEKIILSREKPLQVEHLKAIKETKKINVKHIKKMRKKQSPTLSGWTWLRKSTISPTIKLIAIAMLIPMFRTFASNTYGMDIQFTLKMENVPMKRVLRSIEEQTEFTFVYNSKLVDVDQKVNIDVTDRHINEVLNQLFAGTNINYEIIDRHILLSKKNVDNEILAQQQQITVRGQVRDAQGNPLPGVTVVVKGTTQGTITDTEGRYSLSNVPGNAVLIFSFVGMQTVEIAAEGKQQIDVVMEEETIALEEIVAVGYGTQKKANLTGATTSVNMDDVLGDRPVINAATALRGIIPGLQITSGTGEPGAANTIKIRGAMASINGGSPLILVDNVEMNINMINPNDIESVVVLKDAASSAIYGARAAFGVILITTKKGLTDNRFHIDYSCNFAVSTPKNLPKKATPLQTVTLFKDVGLTNWGSNNIDKWIDLLKEYEMNPSIYPDGFTTIDGVRYNLQSHNSIDDMMSSNGFQQSYNVSATGGSSKSSYRMSVGYIDEDGILVTNKDSYNRYNIAGYVNSNAISWLKPELDIKYASSKRKLPETNATYGIWGSAIAFHSYYPIGTTEINNVEYNYNSPSYLIKKSYPTTTDIDNIRLSGKITLIPLKNFNIIGEYTINKQFYENIKFDPIFTYIRAQDNIIEDSTTPANSKFYHTSEKNTYNALNIYSEYTYQYKQNTFKLMAGFNQEKYYWQQFYETRAEMINQNLPSISGGVGDIYVDDAYSEYSVRGGFYRFNYDYAGKYLFETNGRYDGSSKFPKTSRFGFFPSISAGWRISEENFMNWSRNCINNLKFRISWGNIGNQNIAPYSYVPSMAPYVANWLVDNNRVYTLGMPSLVSSSFTWEKVQTLDFGVDLTMLNNRLNVTYDWYQRDTKDMLAEGAELPSVLGASAPKENVANLQTKGWELFIGWRDKINKINYNLGFNLYDSKTKITKFDNHVGLLSQYYVGMNVNEQWGYTTDRYYTEDDFNTDGTLKNGIPKVEGYTPNIGDVLYVDYDGNGIINSGSNTLEDPGDQRIIGDRSRRYQYGITGGIDWKNLTLSFILQGVGKRDVWYSNELFWPWYDEFSTLMSSQLDYWTPENQDAYFPRVYERAKGNTSANRLTQTKYKLNGAYLSIKNITLSYSLPITKLKVNRSSVFFSVEDLYTFDHLPKGMDPEAGVKQRGWTYPFLTKFSLGLNVKF